MGVFARVIRCMQSTCVSPVLCSVGVPITTTSIVSGIGLWALLGLLAHLLLSSQNGVEGEAVGTSPSQIAAAGPVSAMANPLRAISNFRIDCFRTCPTLRTRIVFARLGGQSNHPLLQRVELEFVLAVEPHSWISLVRPTRGTTLVRWVSASFRCAATFHTE